MADLQTSASLACDWKSQLKRRAHLSTPNFPRIALNVWGGGALRYFCGCLFFKEDLPYGQLEKIQALDPVCASPALNSRLASSRSDILIITLMACLFWGELHELLLCRLSLCDRREMKMGLKWWIMEGEKSISLCKPLRASAAVACHRKCVRVWERGKKTVVHVLSSL